MFAAPTYLSSKLEESPVEDVTCLVYHMFTVYVIVCVSCLLFTGVQARRLRAGSFTSALVVCRLATVCPGCLA